MSSNRDVINQKIAALAYDPKTVMVFNGTKIANVEVPAEDKFEGATYVVMTREKCSYEGNFDVAVPSSYDDVTYPGALLLASNDLLDGRPQELAAERTPLEITMNLPGCDDLSFHVAPSFKAVQEGINAKLAKWFDTHGGKWEIPANFQYSSSLVYDENELALKFGCDISYMSQKLGIDFSETKSEKKSVYIVRFKQIFYMASAERPPKPADVFGEGTTWDDLARAGVSDRHPPLFVKNVQYGRQIYVKFESTLSSTDLEATVKAVCNKDGLTVDMHASVEAKARFDSIDVNLVALGGAATAFKDLHLGSLDDIKKINDVIWANTTLSRDNPAEPLNYYTVYLKDGAPGLVSGKTEYIAEKTERYAGGELRLEHHGGYVAKFSVSWDEVGYVNGVKQTKSINWGGNGHNVTAPYATTIPLNGNVRNLSIKAEGCTGLAWEWWRTSGHQVGLPMVPRRVVSIGGTTLHQTFSMSAA
ncbi:MAG: thiol-activated cytolysin family protein [Aquabacterium sp.]|uniref:thiol-activated cytolysin family protein n=1 Tax=Aquabacterium sp. TaxID=1872578 RepID=UPI0027163E38|nr:thiol-activated cytolysin family protein [Aquabacterium sp.]MDO9002970.1 thiol-activated cytolysin family protein [Aquabacterium sp.]